VEPILVTKFSIVKGDSSLLKQVSCHCCTAVALIAEVSAQVESGQFVATQNVDGRDEHRGKLVIWRKCSKFFSICSFFIKAASFHDYSSRNQWE